MVVGFNLHQHMVGGLHAVVAWQVFAIVDGLKTLNLVAFHDGGVVRVSNHRVLRAGLFGVANHAKQAVRLRFAVNGELGIENLVAAVLAVGLREHHQLHIGGVALELGKGIYQIRNFVLGQSQAPALVGVMQSGHATNQHIDLFHRCSVQFGEQAQRLVACAHDRLGHSVMQHVGHSQQLFGCERGLAEQAVFKLNVELGDAFNALELQTAVVCNVSGFRCPRRDRAKTWRHYQQRA